jgi:NADH-quinone oxidoreductase subunit L
MFEEAVHDVHYTAMYLSLSVAGLGILLAFATYYWKKINAETIAKALSPVHSFLINKWYFDELYQATVVAGTIGLSRVLAWFDTKVIDGIVNGVASVTRMTSFASGRFDSFVVDGVVNFLAYLTGLFGLMLRKIQTGRVQTYIAFVLFGVMVFFFIYRAV